MDLRSFFKTLVDMMQLHMNFVFLLIKMQCSISKGLGRLIDQAVITGLITYW